MTDATGPQSTASLEANLTRVQTRTGGWGYTAAGAWTEPTALALLALPSSHQSVLSEGLRWLRSMQRTDGGWRPAANVDESTWVTALAVLALRRAGELDAANKGVGWLVSHTGRESRWITRVRYRLLGVPEDQSTEYAGWPWFPEAAAWVTPTAFGILALKSIAEKDSSVQARILEGQNFLMSRRCSDGGWNHGSSRALGYEGASYPETTGIALLGLAGMAGSDLEPSFTCAERHLATCHSRVEASWLDLGLLAHGRRGPDSPARSLPPRTVMDCAVALIASRAQGGNNAFLQ